MSMLPTSPDTDVRIGMACAFIESADYDGGPGCRAALAAIRSGYMIFTPPDRLQITQEGEAHLNGERADSGETTK